MNGTPFQSLATLGTPHLADGCLRAGVGVRCAPAGVRPVAGAMRCAGPARPVRHAGSIDVFLEALETSAPGEVLVVDNAGRLDEACVGDLVALEARDAGIAGIVIWGLHRDSREIREIGLPLFSLGALPTGPQRLDPRPPDALARAMVGAHAITPDDAVAADADGVLFVPRARLDDVVAAATAVRDTERRHLDAMRAGRSYRRQVMFGEYLSRRRRDGAYGFRQHLRKIEAAGEA